MIKAILFDMDGVLLDSFEAWCRLFNKALKHFGKKEITKKEFIEGAWAQGSKIASRDFFDSMSMKKIVDFYCKHFRDFRKYVKKNRDANIVLKKLKKKGLKLVVVSNSSHKLIPIILKTGGIKDNFDFVVGGDEVDKAKPAPDMLLYACKKLKIKPKEAIMVGDTNFDMIAAKRAGCIAVGFRIDGNRRIENLKELLKLI